MRWVALPVAVLVLGWPLEAVAQVGKFRAPACLEPEFRPEGSPLNPCPAPVAVVWQRSLRTDLALMHTTDPRAVRWRDIRSQMVRLSGLIQSFQSRCGPEEELRKRRRECLRLKVEFDPLELELAALVAEAEVIRDDVEKSPPPGDPESWVKDE